MANKADATQMVHMRIDQPLLKRLDTFRFKQRFESRSEAARWLLDWALDQKPKPERTGLLGTDNAKKSIQ